MNAMQQEEKSWERREVEWEAARVCERHDFRGDETREKVLLSLLHKAFMRDTEHLRQLKVRAQTLFLDFAPYVLHEGGRLERMYVARDPNLMAVLQQLDEQIRAVAKRYGLEVA